GSVVLNSETRWITKELFAIWLKHFHFHVKWNKEKPGLLILGGHSMHNRNIETIDFARENGIIIPSLPPHTTHRLQPLDRTFYKALMSLYNQACYCWLRTEKTYVTMFVGNMFFGKAHVRSATMSTALNGMKCGVIWPCDRNVWRKVDFVAANRF
ncbi:hypothetical protein LSAT2_009926, partial [Lamellibrachia satsuma]